MNIRELDEESRRTGVWPPRRIILRVDREEQSDDGAAPVKVGEVDLNAPRAGAAPPKPRAVPPPLPAPSLSPSVTPSRRPGLPGSRGVTPAPAVSAEDEEFAKWLDADIASAAAEPEFQAPPVWLPDDVRVRAARRHRRVSRKARSQLFGASAATTLAVGGVAAVLVLAGLSQTESVGGSIGAPSIGLFGNPPPQPASDEPAQPVTQTPTPAAKTPAKKPSRRSASRRPRRSTPAPTPSGSANRSSGATSSPRASSPAPSTARAPTQASNPPPPPVRRAPSNPPPPPPASPPASNEPAVVWERPSAPTGSGTTAPSRPATTAPSRPATSVPSSPAP